ncbi:nucleoside diphosphate-linked moiety X motif 19 [Drosophila innubila]|uniref:nucleoside diphosphate-linked moiety X motif 19 n=1 Tax=Drosophila innubila TaxID=198719 RepID=UPI00148E0DE1|nr:nucleoside diphosphate-linked moiety X motif 19 [Drosophila innubila]
MSKQVTTKLRQSASLILLAKDRNAAPPNFDYNALLLTRNSKSSFMPDSSVFPGGVCEQTDSSPAWLTHFQRHDTGAAKLREFCRGLQTASLNPKDQSLNSAISLRLTALRETFEEMGILLCRDQKTGTSTAGYAQFNEQFDRQHWQHEVHNDASKFLLLCEKLEVLPDLWSLHEWSAWRTPSTFKTRFQTAFYVAALKDRPKVMTEPKEVQDYAWRSPLDYLQRALKKEIWLPPPQFYELSRCLNFQSLEQLRQFAQQRESKGYVLTHPVMYKCTDGLVHLFPGDDMYPDDPDASADKIDTGMSTEAFRALAKKNLHRSEQRNQHKTQLLINFNPPDGQVNPIDPRTL